jgi:RNase P/RNase MRP subunit POP5
LDLRVEFSMTGSAVPAGRFCAASVVAEQSNAARSLVQSIREIAKRNLQAVHSGSLKPDIQSLRRDQKYTRCVKHK